MIRDIIKKSPGVAEWSIALVCKTSGFPYVGSNPTPWTHQKYSIRLLEHSNKRWVYHNPEGISTLIIGHYLFGD